MSELFARAFDFNRDRSSRIQTNMIFREAWGLAKRIAQAFLNRNVTVPMIATQVIASALNIAVNLYGEEILVAMVKEPEAAHHDLQIINEVLMEMHRWYRENIPMNQLQPVAIGGRAHPP